MLVAQQGSGSLTTAQLDVGNILNLMVTMMIVVMMMKMMTKASEGLG